jgi:hypothetical protein
MWRCVKPASAVKQSRPAAFTNMFTATLFEIPVLIFGNYKSSLGIDDRNGTSKYRRTPISADSVSAVYRGPKKKLEN